jgi:hypothetical protein
MSKQIVLYNQEADARIDALTEGEFDVLIYYLNLAGEDTEQPGDHHMNERMLDVIERESQRFAAEGKNLPAMGKVERGQRSAQRAADMQALVAKFRNSMRDGQDIVFYWKEE